MRPGAVYYAAPDRFVYLETCQEEGQHYRDDGRWVDMDRLSFKHGVPPDQRRVPVQHQPSRAGVELYRKWEQPG